MPVTIERLRSVVDGDREDLADYQNSRLANDRMVARSALVRRGDARCSRMMLVNSFVQQFYL